MKQEKLQKILRIKQKLTLVLDYFYAFLKLILGVIGSLAAIGLIWALSENLLQSRRIDNTTIFLILLSLASFGVFYWMFRLCLEELKECRIKGEALSAAPLPLPLPYKPILPDPSIKLCLIPFTAALAAGGLLDMGIWGMMIYSLVLILLCFEAVRTVKELKRQRELNRKGG